MLQENHIRLTRDACQAVALLVLCTVIQRPRSLLQRRGHPARHNWRAQVGRRAPPIARRPPLVQRPGLAARPRPPLRRGPSPLGDRARLPSPAPLPEPAPPAGSSPRAPAARAAPATRVEVVLGARRAGRRSRTPGRSPKRAGARSPRPRPGARLAHLGPGAGLRLGRRHGCPPPGNRRSGAGRAPARRPARGRAGWGGRGRSPVARAGRRAIVARAAWGRRGGVRARRAGARSSDPPAPTCR